MIFNEIKCRDNTCLGLVGGIHPLHPPVSAPGSRCDFGDRCSSIVGRAKLFYWNT